MRLAGPIVLAQDLASARQLVPALVSDQSGVYAAQASEALRLTIEQRSGVLDLNAALTSTATLRNVYVRSQRSNEADFIRSLDALARALDPHAVAFGTHNPRALRAFVAAVFSPELEAKISKLKEATTNDPSFGLAYSVLIETLAHVKSPEVGSTVANADSKRAGFTETDRVRYDFARARATNAAIEKQASAGLVLTSLLPNDTEALASTASILFRVSKAADASRLMDRALTLNPGNPALQQQFAMGLIQNRQFAEAEKHLNAIRNQPAVLPALAFCVLFQGDRARATGIYDQYLNSLPSKYAKTLLGASWQAHTGDLNGAIASLDKAQFQDPRLLFYAKTQLVIFNLVKGDREGARKAAQNAGPIAEVLASGASSASEWRNKVEALPSAIANDDVKRTLLANGAFLFGFYDQAAEAWREVDRVAGSSEPRARVMLAASLQRAGQAGEAQAIPVQPFVPDLNDLFSVVSFSELRKRLGQAG
jgi:tetratricopeptide (TPR) repeat protein